MMRRIRTTDTKKENRKVDGKRKRERERKKREKEREKKKKDMTGTMQNPGPIRGRVL